MKLRLITLALLMSGAVSPAARADDKRELFVESNILAVFYHELGHAVIDLMNVPKFGKEEVTADAMAVLLIDWLFEEQTAQEIACDSAIGYLRDSEQLEDVA